ncbi:T9SS type A sorting domain-containing protein [Aestuariibaculum sp. YM273]|uniref:T9SS type A sorting domain-containing protein n=1 Tax=Aestuariibaculum sp. YM273 TaxID=3070659 RepID=UPI0027DBB8AB|nr:T9SS type A sorting domain-containing protein [Aestuariibaculum sp. YM273]WMI65042.1 T9SS type A sorting domain-containing protein [Aestuariibaculum sp. YM273]
MEVTDDNGCKAYASYEVMLPEAFSASATGTDVTCNDEDGTSDDGSIDATLTNGVSPFTYSWTGPDGYTASTEDISGLAAGTYNLEVTDDNGCKAYASYEVMLPEAFSASATGTDVTCNDEDGTSDDGSIDATLTNGVSPFTYSWTGPDGYTASTEDISGLAAGTYNLEVTDDNGCKAYASYEVMLPPLLECNASTGELMCEGLPISLSVVPTGGTAPYQIKWTSTGSATYDDDTSESTTAYGAVIGEIFTATITDAKGCQTTCIVTANLYNCVPSCETAFGVATYIENGLVYVNDGDNGVSSCFRNDGFQRWGWVNKITEFGSHEFSLYAGAGRCDISKGDYAGTVTLNYAEDGTVDVVYEMLEGFVLSEAHVYVGCDPYPKTKKGDYTVAPGQYSFNAGDLGYVQTTFSTPSIVASGDFYFIAHAVVCKTDIPDGLYLPASPMEGGAFSPPSASFVYPECEVDTGGWGKVGDTKAVTFTAYPVPFEEEVTVSYKFDYETNVKIDVYDLKGAVIQKAENNNYRRGTVDRTKLDFSRFNDQMYFVRLTTNKGTLVKKVISSKKQQIKR